MKALFETVQTKENRPFLSSNYYSVDVFTSSIIISYYFGQWRPLVALYALVVVIQIRQVFSGI